MYEHDLLGHERYLPGAMGVVVLHEIVPIDGLESQQLILLQLLILDLGCCVRCCGLEAGKA